MPNYNIIECITNDVYVVSATTLTLGTTISFFYGEGTLCGVVSGETSDPTDSTYSSDFSTCCECLSAITESLNFGFITCDTDQNEINIEAINFCNDYGVPITGETYEIRFDIGEPFCAKFIGLSPTGETNYNYVNGPFTSCENCQNMTPTTISAGTESKICVICCPCGSSGSTITNVSPPHPTWINLQGQSVVLLDAIQLGGINGLNA